MLLKSSPIFSEEALVTWQFDALFFFVKGYLVEWSSNEAAEKGVKVKATLYKYTYYDSKLLVPVVCFPELFKTSLWTFWAEQHVLYNDFCQDNQMYQSQGEV